MSLFNVFDIAGSALSAQSQRLNVVAVLPFVYNIGLTGFRASVLAWIFLGGLVSIEQSLIRQSSS